MKKWLKEFAERHNRNKRFQIWPFHGGFGIDIQWDHAILKLYFVAFFLQRKDVDWFSAETSVFKLMFSADMLKVEIAHFEYKKVFWMPWGLEHLRWEILDTISFGVLFYNQKTGNKHWDWVESYELQNDAALLGSSIYRFSYDLRSERKDLLVCAHLRRGVWYYRGLPFVHRSYATVELEFNDEFGSCSGSWKGGIMGCGRNVKIDLTRYFDAMVDEALSNLCHEDKHSVFVSNERVDKQVWLDFLSERKAKYEKAKDAQVPSGVSMVAQPL